MQAGDLDTRVTLQRPVTVVDPDYGAQPAGWETYAARVPAQVRDNLPSKTEGLQGGMVQATLPARVRMRYARSMTKDITPDMRVIVHGDSDDFYQITSPVSVIGRREWIEFTIEAYTT